MAKKNSKSGTRAGYGSAYGGYGRSDTMFAVQEAYKSIRTNIIL